MLVVFDNGGAHLRLEGGAVPNVIARTRDRRTHVGGAVLALDDYTSLHLRRPHARGQLLDYAAQKAIWDATLPNLKGQAVAMTEAYFAFEDENVDTLLFHEYAVERLLRVPPATLVSFAPECAKRAAVLVLDCGYSYTHAVPVLHHAIQHAAVRRLDVGGKLLANLLKETLSYRQWDMMDEPYLTTKVMHACCFVAPSLDTPADDVERWSYAQLMEKPDEVALEYCLPDYATVPADDRARYGYARPPQQRNEDEQVLSMAVERFQIPEVLFNPGQIGLEQASLPELVQQAIAALPADYRDIMWSNIALVGGLANLPGLKERLEMELRSLAPTDIPVSVTMADKPEETALRGGLALAQAAQNSAEAKFLKTHTITRDEWLAKGTALSRERFDSWNK